MRETKKILRPYNYTYPVREETFLPEVKFNKKSFEKSSKDPRVGYLFPQPKKKKKRL